MLAVAVIAAGVYVVVRRSHPGYPRTWDPRVASIATFVQRDRQLQWKHPVRVEFLDAAAFVKKIGGKDPAGADSAYDRTVAASMRAMGLVWGKVDLAASGRSLSDNGVVGLYVPDDKTLYVKGLTLTPFVQTVVAHELTHALQDQYFDLAAMKGGRTDNEEATTALMEGDAVRVQDDFARSLPPAERQKAVAEQNAGARQADTSITADQVPPFLSDLMSFPYDFGPTMVQVLLSRGGAAGLDRAFRSPPSQDRQVINPDSYDAGGRPVVPTLPALPAGAKVLEAPSGFGELPLLETLAHEIGFSAAWPAAQGTVGDSYEVYRAGARTCVNLAVAARSATATSALFAAGRSWAGALPGATVTSAGRVVRFSSCDPGPGWKPRQPSDPYPYVAARAALVGALVESGLGGGGATCRADYAMAALGPAVVTRAVSAAGPSDPAVGQVRAALEAAGPSCR